MEENIIMITASVVIFNSKQEELSKLLQSIENANCVERLFVIDNNACDENKHFFEKMPFYSHISLFEVPITPCEYF